jgi:hypothetical protein
MPEKYGLTNDIGGIMRLDFYEDGKRIAFAVYNRQGQLQASAGTIPKDYKP